MAVEESNVQKLARERQEREKELQLEKVAFSYDNLSAMTGYQQELISVLHRTVAKNTSNAELAYFLNVCKSVGLNPINKEIWCYKNNKGDLLVFTGRDGFLKKNKENPNYLGMKHAVVCEYDEFEIDMVKGDVTVHKISNNRGKPIGAYCYVYIKDKKDTFVYLDFEEFDLKQALWVTKPKAQIDKCAQSHALREAAAISGIQAAEAFDTSSGIARSTEDIAHEEVKNDNVEEERLIALINAVTTSEALKKLFKECTTPESIGAYDAKMKTFE